MMKRTGVLLSVALLAGCATTRGPDAPNQPAGGAATASIDYETSPCFGACPVYRVTIRADGVGVFTGIRFTGVTGVRAFAATPAQFDAFAAALLPYRPVGVRRYTPGQPGCEQAATDQPSIAVRWIDTQGASSLDYYLGCNMRANGGMADALLSAPATLPITAFIDRR